MRGITKLYLLLLFSYQSRWPGPSPTSMCIQLIRGSCQMQVLLQHVEGGASDSALIISSCCSVVHTLSSKDRAIRPVSSRMLKNAFPVVLWCRRDSYSVPRNIDIVRFILLPDCQSEGVKPNIPKHSSRHYFFSTSSKRAIFLDMVSFNPGSDPARRVLLLGRVLLCPFSQWGPWYLERWLNLPR